MDAAPAALSPAGQSPTSPPKYECGSFQDVPRRVFESGIVKIVGVEDASTNKYMRADGGWCYLVVECKPSKEKHQPPEPIQFREWLPVYEFEFEAWKKEGVK